MFEQFFYDRKHLTKQKFNAKYTVPVLLWVLGLVLFGQVVFILMPLSQNNKVSGSVQALNISIISYTTHKYTKATPDYGLLITLDNGITYKIQEHTVIYDLNASLKLGDPIIIYYPTTILRVISAGLARDVSQVQRGNQVLYSWQRQQNEEWFVVGFLLLAMGLFYGLKWYFDN